jgi:hypothetical protein
MDKSFLKTLRNNVLILSYLCDACRLPVGLYFLQGNSCKTIFAEGFHKFYIYLRFLSIISSVTNQVSPNKHALVINIEFTKSPMKKPHLAEKVVQNILGM